MWSDCGQAGHHCAPGQAQERRKPLLCKGFQGGRWRDRTADLCRVEAIHAYPGCQASQGFPPECLAPRAILTSQRFAASMGHTRRIAPSTRPANHQIGDGNPHRGALVESSIDTVTVCFPPFRFSPPVLHAWTLGTSLWVARASRDIGGERKGARPTTAVAECQSG